MLKYSTTGAKEFNRKIKRVKSEGLFTKKVMGLVGAQGVSIIRQETLKGRDAKGRRFVKYSNNYLKYKTSRGDPKVNLNDKGQMLSSISIKSKTNRAELFFSKTKEALKAHGHNTGSGNAPKRRFFGIRSKRQRELMAVVTKSLKKIIK